MGVSAQLEDFVGENVALAACDSRGEGCAEELLVAPGEQSGFPAPATGNHKLSLVSLNPCKTLGGTKKVLRSWGAGCQREIGVRRRRRSCVTLHLGIPNPVTAGCP